MTNKEYWKDFFVPPKEGLTKSEISPRVILLDPNGNFILVLHERTGWWGLPGGGVALAEGGGDFLLIGAFPTLVREVSEEIGLDISPYLPNGSACLGITEVFSVNSVTRQITRKISPIFICLVPDLSGAKQNITLLTSTPPPGPLFPDARIALKYFFERVRAKTEGTIIPEFLNQGEVYCFQMKPKPQLLIGPPLWV